MPKKTEPPMMAAPPVEVEGQVVPEVEGQVVPEVKECPAAPVAVSLAEGQAEVKLVAAPVAANSSQ